MSCKKCGMRTDLTTGLGRCFCAPPSVWELGEECPNCQAGTLQADPEGLVCAGECGEFFRPEKTLLMEGRATAKSTSLGSIELTYKQGVFDRNTGRLIPDQHLVDAELKPSTVKVRYEPMIKPLLQQSEIEYWTGQIYKAMGIPREFWSTAKEALATADPSMNAWTHHTPDRGRMGCTKPNIQRIAKPYGERVPAQDQIPKITPSDIKDTYGVPMITHLIPILRKYEGMVCNEDLRKQVAKDLEEILKRECRD